MTAKKILIADDDQDILDAIQQLLQIFHYNVDVVKEGGNIVSKVKSTKPDLLLLDLWLSGVNGVDVCQQIRKEKDVQKTPIILFSASNDIKKNSTLAGADDFLEKPFDMDKLLEKIQKYVN